MLVFVQYVDSQVNISFPKEYNYFHSDVRNDIFFGCDTTLKTNMNILTTIVISDLVFYCCAMKLRFTVA